jgi:hypothetical protein
MVIVAVYDSTGEYAGTVTLIPSGSYVKVHMLLPPFVMISAGESNVPPAPNDNWLQFQFTVAIEPVGIQEISLAGITPTPLPIKSVDDAVICVVHGESRSSHAKLLVHESFVRFVFEFDAVVVPKSTAVGYCEQVNVPAVTFNVIHASHNHNPIHQLLPLL